MNTLQLAIGAIVAIIIAGLVATAAIYRGNAIAAEAETKQARADLATASAVNDANQATIGRMKAQAEHDAQLTAELAVQVAASNQALIDNNAAVAALKEANADVRNFLAQPVPPDLRRLYVKPKAAGAR
ncbi:hypothetical protein [Mesorhizobium sp. ES1-4]|uniref:hypothetical protein n=1 Tax=Mesorhizobium sp. ES1-4 TaxID=2876627 RepID=UPI001CCB113D|nr:hypothetical protein [Mesorhizobium sp. ES1-4]MBZ9794326.1 hypothetical protein [Mesorhizobium sp. ES1-4]